MHPHENNKRSFIPLGSPGLRPDNPNHKFPPIGGGLSMKLGAYAPLSSSSTASSSYASDFVVSLSYLGAPGMGPIPTDQKKNDKLPDIYTTCPELKTFAPSLSLAARNYNVNNNLLFPPNTSANNNNSNININNNNLVDLTNISNLNNNNGSAADIEINDPFAPKPVKTLPLPSHGPYSTNEKNVKPCLLGFRPMSEWPTGDYSLNELKDFYFTRRNGAARQFTFKLYNALCITKVFPEAYPYVGAMWLSNEYFKVDCRVFGPLLGIKAVQGGLFHKQGNFVRHGFSHILKRNIDPKEMTEEFNDVDDYNVRIYFDDRKLFRRDVDYNPSMII